MTACLRSTGMFLLRAGVKEGQRYAGGVFLGLICVDSHLMTVIFD